MLNGLTSLRARVGQSLRWSGLGLVVLAGHGVAGAQATQLSAGGPTVTWTSSPAIDAKPGGRATLVLHGTVKDGWHVYGLKQQPSGPTPLLVTLDANDLASLGGKPGGSPPTLAQDSAFGFVTPYYIQNFTLTVPVQLKAHLPAGQRAIPLSVRFQTCNGQICQPPKTVHLSAPLNVRVDA